MEKKDIHKEIEETLSSLDGIGKAEPSTLFYEKVMMRLENREAKVITMTPRVVWQAAACIAVLIALNILVCVRFNKSNNGQAQAKRNPVAEEYFTYLRTAQF